jgi:8-oxo-dGTP pyrophosphatase MutT (NUDIX family)
MTQEKSPTPLVVSVKGIVMRDDRVLLVRNERSEWELLGGKVDPGESEERSVVREIAEECGLALETVRRLEDWVYREIVPGRSVRIVTFGCREVAVQEAMMSDEHNDMCWLGLDEIPTLPMPDGYKESIAAWVQRGTTPGV